MYFNKFSSLLNAKFLAIILIIIAYMLNCLCAFTFQSHVTEITGYLILVTITVLKKY